MGVVNKMGVVKKTGTHLADFDESRVLTFLHPVSELSV